MNDELHIINVERLNKLIEFLDGLDSGKFDFSVVYIDPHECRTPGCAIGWTTVVFPDLVSPGIGDKLIYNHEDGEPQYDTYEYIAHYLFNVSSWLGATLFCPYTQDLIHPKLPMCDDRAKPKKVADMLRKFIELAKVGEIEGHRLP